MILVVNLNPSLDKIYTVDRLEYGGVVRAAAVQNTAGGKGTHVANVVNILGEQCTVTGFLGGYIGIFIADVLKKKQIADESIRIQAQTRSCINIADADGQQTEVLEPGPLISEAERHAFMVRYRELVAGAAVVAASGSLPANLPPDFYCELAQIAHERGVPFLLDTSGAALEAGIKAKPFFIKPNRYEAELLTGKAIDNVADAAAALKMFSNFGIEMPCISLGKDGSMLYYKDTVYQAKPPVYKAVNAVGSGDAFVAGAAVALTQGLPAAELLRLASACGTANVLEAESGFVRLAEVEKIRALVEVEPIIMGA